MKVLYLADPNSIHDIKWISWFTDNNFLTPLLLSRSIHFQPDFDRTIFPIIGYIPDFSVAKFWRTLFAVRKIKKIIKRNNVEIIHIMYAEPNALWCLFRKYFGIPMIITCRGTDVLVTIPQAFQQKTLINYFVAPAYKYAFLNADWITATSTRQIESIKNFSGRKNKINIIRTGVDVERVLADTRNHFPLRSAKPFILFPRYIKPLYNQEFNLKAIARLSREIKEKYTMVFVGKNAGDPIYQSKLEKQMSELPDVSFEFLEKQSQEAVFELYKKASLIVMTPLSDGSPVSGMEAMLCGVPLVLGPLNYDSDIFLSAVKLNNWDDLELAMAITNVLSGEVQVPALSEKTKEAIDRNYNMQQMAMIYQQLFNMHG